MACYGLPMQSGIANNSDSAKWLTIPQAAQYLGVSTDTVRRCIKEYKTLPAVLFAGKWRIRIEDLHGFTKGKAA